MFGFDKKKKKEKKVDKLVMGAIVGVAVGSVVGASMRSKKKEVQQPTEPKFITHAPPEPRSQLGRLFKKLFSRKHKNPRNPVVEEKTKQPELKKIPHEFE